MTRRDDADLIRRMLEDRLEELLTELYPGWVQRKGMAFLTPKGPKDLGSFQVHLHGQRRGQWYRHSQKIGGHVIELISYAETNGVTAYAQAFRMARRFLGMSDEPAPDITERREKAAREARARRERQEREDRARRQRRAQTAQEIWAECRPIAGTLSERYLVRRGIPVPPDGWPDVLGHHDGLVYELDDAKPIFPALVARVQGVDGETVAVWRIYLDPETAGKADVENAKVGLGPAGGGAVRLGGEAEHIGVAEGLETALGAWFLIRMRHPVWATLSTSGMIGFEIPPWVKKLTIYPDGDRPVRRDKGAYVPAVPPGRRAAETLHQRALQADVGSVIAPEPHMGSDYLDLWRAAAAAEAA